MKIQKLLKVSLLFLNVLDELSQKELGEINKEFNIKYYWHHLEKLQEEYDEAEGEGDDLVAQKKLEKRLKLISSEYYKTLLQAQPLSEDFKNNYEQWVADEVLGYYD